MTKESRDPQVTCTSVFVEPVEWMGPLLLGHKDGKVNLFVQNKFYHDTRLYYCSLCFYTVVVSQMYC